jgi:hypothetical protein
MGHDPVRTKSLPLQNNCRLQFLAFGMLAVAFQRSKLVAVLAHLATVLLAVRTDTGTSGRSAFLRF